MRVAFALALLASAILAACGGSSTGGSKTSTTPAAGLTKAQYIARADPICAAGKRRAPTARINALIGQFPTPTQEIARLLRKTATIVKEVRDQLAAIPPPPADRAAIARWIGQDAAIGDLVSRAAGQVAAGDLAGAVKSQQDITAAATDPLTFAKDYGMAACSSIGA